MVDPKFGAPTGDSDAALDGEEPSDKPSAEGATALESSESQLGPKNSFDFELKCNSQHKQYYTITLIVFKFANEKME